MRKSLLLSLVLFLPNVNYSHITDKLHLHGAAIEVLSGTINYNHPKPLKVGDLMPELKGVKVSWTSLYGMNIKTKEMRYLNELIGYDLNGDKIPEYEFLTRPCDSNEEFKNYAVYDVPHKLLYIDSNLNNHIDQIVLGLDNLQGKTLTMISAKCEDE